MTFWQPNPPRRRELRQIESLLGRWVAALPDDDED